MPSVRKSVIVPHSCESMFALVDDVERYPEFLPWCPSTEVFERDAATTRARLDIDYHGLRSQISTLNRKQPPERMTLQFVDGPFEDFSGAWRFARLGDAGCRVELELDYRFRNAALAKLLGPVFGYLTDTLVERFVERADALDATGGEA